MVWITAVLMAVVGLSILLLPIFVRRRYGDPFSPIKNVTYFYLLGVPYYFLVAWDREIINDIVTRSIWVTDLDGAIVRAGLLSLVSFLATIAGVATAMPLPRIRRKNPRLHEPVSKRKQAQSLILSSLILTLLAMIVYVWYVTKVGGLANLWLNLNLRTQLTAGLGYIAVLYRGLLTAAIVLILYAVHRLGMRNHRLLTNTLILGAALVFASLGGRSRTFFLVWIVLLSLHYWGRVRTLRVNFKTLTVVVLLIAFFITLPLFRSQGAIERYRHDPFGAFTDAWHQIERRLFARLSPLDTRIVMVSYFKPGRFWYGRSYVDLLFAPLPRRLVGEKPPVDDGMYIYSIALGREITPSLPASQLNVTSWPAGNWIGYANFGVIGLLLLSYLSGLILRFTYEHARRNEWEPLSFFIYALMSWGGGLSFSNLDLVSFSMNCVVVGSALAVFKRVRWTSGYAVGKGVSDTLVSSGS